jgi:hypothetical protein
MPTAKTTAALTFEESGCEDFETSAGVNILVSAMNYRHTVEHRARGARPLLCVREALHVGKCLSRPFASIAAGFSQGLEFRKAQR